MSELVIRKKGNCYSLIYNNDAGETKTFCLEEVTPYTVYEKRRNKIPSFVLKYGESLFWGEVDPKIHYISTDVEMDICVWKEHKCASSDGECKNFFRCSKVLNRSKAPGVKLSESKRIEKYSFIHVGYETFCTSQDCFVVLDCAHYS